MVGQFYKLEEVLGAQAQHCGHSLITKFVSSPTYNSVSSKSSVACAPAALKVIRPFSCVIASYSD